MQLHALMPTKKNLTFLFIATFLVRACFFYFYIQHEQRYQQADSPDYHMLSLALALNKGMIRLNDGQPNFWRTPGYPYYLHFFNKAFGIKGAQFEDNVVAHKTALWVQIFLCSFTPLILLYLAWFLSGSLLIAWLVALISVVHIGLILASVFLLTEGITLLLFYLFLLFFFKTFTTYGQAHSAAHWKKYTLYAALLLGLVTWIRPMGLYVAIACAILLMLIARDNFKLKFKKIVFFLTFFFITLVPWYMRNHQLTGKWFFCPMFGTYLNCFIAPKIVRETQGLPLLESWQQQHERAYKRALQDLPYAKATGKVLVPDEYAGYVAWPLVLAHPAITAYYWVKESLKTAFDLYSYQLVAIAMGNWKWDPLEEHLSEKIGQALYQAKLPLWMRGICLIDFLYTLIMWLGVFGGICVYLLYPLFKRFRVPNANIHMAAFWFKLLFLSAAIIGMTGGFGYARLRLPVEPLLLVLALIFWLSYCLHKKVHIQ